jgi:hypothetical protein
MVNIIMLSVVMVNVVMLSVFKVNAFVLSVIMVTVIMQNCHSRASLQNKLDRFFKTYLHYLGNSSSQTPSLTCERGGLRQVRLFKTHILRIILRIFENFIVDSANANEPSSTPFCFSQTKNKILKSSYDHLTNFFTTKNIITIKARLTS